MALAEASRAPLFQVIKYRPYRRGEAELNGERLHRINAWQMVPASPRGCNHTFRDTGIAVYLENGGRVRIVSRSMRSLRSIFEGRPPSTLRSARQK